MNTKIIIAVVIVAIIAFLGYLQFGKNDPKQFGKVIQIIPGSGNAPVFALTEDGQVAYFTQTTDAEGNMQSGWVPILLPE